MSKKDEIIIVRRPEEEIASKKGGVWKIAHADFMTAMMAFFLIMWLVNATDEEIKKSIANYFNPLNLTSSPVSQKGLSDPTEDAIPASAGDERGRQAGQTPLGIDMPGDRGNAQGGGNVEEGNQRTMASAGILEQTDNAAFNDPYAQLASAASDVSPDEPTSVDVPDSTLGVTGTQTLTEAERDPFDPAYWQTTPARPAQTLRTGRADSADIPPPDAVIDAAAARPRGEDPEAAEAPFPPTPTPQPANAAANPLGNVASVGPRSRLAEAILASAPPADQKSAGEAEVEEDPGPSAAKAAQAELQQALSGLRAEVSLGDGDKAVVISLTDDSAFSMFAIGSSEPTTSAQELFREVGEVLATRDGRIIVRGHTDARPFRGGTSDNWVLSFQRAHATKNALAENGVDETRFRRVEGLADREPKRPDDPFADENRRIEILYEPAENAQ